MLEKNRGTANLTSRPRGLPWVISIVFIARSTSFPRMVPRSHVWKRGQSDSPPVPGSPGQWAYSDPPGGCHGGWGNSLGPHRDLLLSQSVREAPAPKGRGFPLENKTQESVVS